VAQIASETDKEVLRRAMADPAFKAVTDAAQKTRRDLMTCPRCGSVLSAVTFACVRGDKCRLR